MVRPASDVVDHIDPGGRHFLVHLPPGCTNPAEGHILGPPILTEDVLDPEWTTEKLLVRLGNELRANGIITEKDAQQNPSGVTKAIRDACSVIVSIGRLRKAYGLNGD